MNPSRVSDKLGNEFDLTRISCPTCGPGAQTVIGQRGGRYHRYGLGVVTTIVQCARCMLLFPNPFPFPTQPQTLYGDPDKYFGDSPSSEKIDNNRRTLERLRSLAGMPIRTLLDVGSGQGEMLLAARQVNIEPTGIEFSDAMIARAHARFGLVVEKCSIEQLAARDDRQFDAVILNAVLEHVYDPDSMIRSAGALCAPGAILYIDVPHEPNLVTQVGNFFNRLMGSTAVYNLQPTWPPFHVFGFNQRAMTKLLDKHGFDLLWLKVWSFPNIPASSQFKDRAKAFVASQLIRIGNHTGTATNMSLFARRRLNLTS